jgi:hypothetical protein
MSKSLAGYTTIDKSLSGIITISDGGGTTISEGNIICKSITVEGGSTTGLTADNFNATTLDGDDTTYYRLVLTDDRDADGTPYPFYTDTYIQYIPENTVLYCAAWQVWCRVESQVPVTSNEYPLFFGNNLITEAANDIYQTSKITYQPANQTLSVKNFSFSNSINGISALNFSNYMSWVPLLYDSLGGNRTAGTQLPIWSDAYNQIIFPTSLRTYGNWVVDKASYFAEAGNVFNKNLYVNDANFNKKNFLQLCIEGNGSSSGYNNVVGIDFTSWSGRTNAACRIYGQDNQNYSSDLVFVTAPSGGISTTPTERMRITADGSVLIGTPSSSSGYQLEIAGGTKTTSLTVGSILASAVSIASYIFCEKTTGPINICNNASFTSTITIGNNTNLTGNVNLYGADCNLYGSNWKAVTQATSDSSTKIATTAFVKNNITALDTTYIKTSATGDQIMNSNLLMNGYYLQGTIESITVGGGASNQYVDVVCSEDGMRVYTFASGGKTVYGSYNGGKTWAGLYSNPATTTINNICCSASGRYIFVSFASFVCQYSANGGNSWQALTISGLTTYFPKTYISCSYENGTSTLQIGVTNNNTTSGRVEIYVASAGIAGGFSTGAYISGSTAQNITHCFTEATTSPNLLISTGAGQTVYACSGLMSTPLTSSDIVFSGTTITGKIRSNYGADFAMLPTTANLYQSQTAGLSDWTSAVATGSYSSHCNREGTIFVYTAAGNIWLSNNQYTEKVSYGSSTPFYELIYNAAPNQVKDAYVSASGNRVYFVVTGSTALDKIYYFDIKRTSSVYNTDFVVSKERQTVRASFPMEPLGTTVDVLLRDKTCYIGSSCTLALPFYSYYCLTGGTGFTLTLPKINDYMLDIMMVFFHSGTKSVVFNCNSADAIVPPATTLIITGTTYTFTPTSTNNRIHLMPILCQSIQKSYLWMVLI